MLKRGAGILLPISSLHSKYGIGTFGKQAYEFVDFLCSGGQKYWQILPIGPVSYGDSPYQSFSCFAGNPYYIDLDLLIKEGFVTEKEVNSYDFGNDSLKIDYENLFNNRFILLKKIFQKNRNNVQNYIDKFKEENSWAENYALFMALKYKNNQSNFLNWDKNLANHEKSAVEKAKMELGAETDFWIFFQHLFFKQYFMLKNYANKKGVSIIGDVPIYASFDSADVWGNNSLFLLNENKIPKMVAGVPPDDYSKDGQLWGNPLYDWDYMKKTNYEWWIERIKWSFKLYDVVRIDHFRGFDEFYAIPYGSLTAQNGIWLLANGKEMFDMVKSKLGNLNIIAEDLGIITNGVNELRKHTGFLGMKVLQFAFDGSKDNPYLPENYEENSAAYTGTHDNDTLKGWMDSLTEVEKNSVLKSLNISNLNSDAKDSEGSNEVNDNIYLNKDKLNITGNVTADDLNTNFEIIEKLYESKSLLCIIPMQDFLCVGSEGRINIPSTVGLNWRWRLSNNLLTDELAEKIKNMVFRNNR